MFFKFKTFLTVLTLLSTLSLFGGVKIITESTDTSTKEKVVGTLLIDGDNIRMDPKENSEQTILYNLKNKTVTLLNHKDKTYMTMSKTEINKMKTQMKAQIKAIMEQQKAALAQLPPEQRAAVEAQMKMMAGEEDKTPVIYTKMKKTEKWNGKTCTYYKGMKGKKKVEEMCTVPAKKLKCSLVELERLVQVGNEYSMNGEGEPSWQEFKTRGVPVKNVSYSGGKVVGTHKIVAIDKANIGIDKFKIPKGYKKTQMPAIPKK